MSHAIRWTPEMLLAYQTRIESRKDKPKASKYGNEKRELDGETFDSKKELARWQQLQQMERAGLITDLKRQVPFVLAPAVKLAGEARTKPALRYYADATYMHGGQLVVEDVKSAPTRKTSAYRIKKHLMKTVLGLDITEL